MAKNLVSLLQPISAVLQRAAEPFVAPCFLL